jgi:DNA polymerase-1
MSQTNQSSQPERKLLLIDGLNVVRRVYEAIPAADSPEKAEGALKSSLSSIMNSIRLHRPSHLLVAFDYGGTNWRHQLSGGTYRANRKPMPQVLRDALDGFYSKLWSEHGIANLSREGLEADDIIAIVARRWLASSAGSARSCVIVQSTDKDLCQLVAEGVEVYDHFKQEYRHRSWIKAKFGVDPELLGDLLALTGDSVDGIKGVPGVGAKTAAKLLNEYGSLDAIIAAAPSFKGKLRANLMASIDLVRLSRRLIDFAQDVELGLTWSSILAPQLPTRGPG